MGSFGMYMLLANRPTYLRYVEGNVSERTDDVQKQRELWFAHCDCFSLDYS